MKPRRSKRIKCSKAGRIFFNEGASSDYCTMRNFSDHGAMVQLNNPQYLSHEVELELLHEGVSVLCHVIWQNSDTLGLAFKSSWKQVRHVDGLGDPHPDLKPQRKDSIPNHASNQRND
ncbi:MAG: PilZ domain-containing protein [Methyloligellaceae bacterium]